MGLSELVTAFRNNQLPITDYLVQLEQRFEAIEPAIESFVPEAGRFERVRREAAALEASYSDPAGRPALYGVPVGVKDIFHVAGMLTRAGSRLPAEALQGPESAAVAALRAAGALILGKTVTTEFAWFGPGPTRNPHRPEHTPGGSSSGSAAAVAAGLCPLAMGTQTIGSIIRPAAFCGVVGYKPSFGRISTAGVIPLSPGLDHVGAFATDVAGVALAAGVLCQQWDPARIEAAASRRPVLGVPDGPYLEQAGAEAQTHFQQVTQRLLAAGYDVRHIPAMADFDAIRARHNLIVAAEAAHVHAVWFDRYRDCYHPKTVELIERGQTVTSEALARALEGRAALQDELTGLMDAHQLDGWLAPSALGPAPKGLESTGDPVMNLPWTYGGLPVVGLPTGQAASGLPLGTQVVGRWWGDEALLGWSAAHVAGALAQRA